jgi:hypothetical protein
MFDLEFDMMFITMHKNSANNIIIINLIKKNLLSIVVH